MPASRLCAKEALARYALCAYGNLVDRSNAIEVTPAVAASNQRFGVFGLALGELANPELRKKGK
ncbi:hypothetical protein N7491_004450 [Penicillium cf. griseofulvum]|uniref:Uncharacterized protein n=1 Tax=Penicillium cf. griseofulvum TaxID=2972120 RepID=A0A9W9M3S7_9EURO|nr:hypothetical protein N7472_007139 [Penicillium cf. griseofulvum]KAJ5433855.1 hypothetical protein N7491_004450 [Penicillium cf. griseofulvum]